MKCPYCGTLEDKVVDSRPSDEGETIRRRRECAQCLKRFTTYEKVEIQPLVVIKKDNSRETFNRDKLMRGISRACEKRPVSADEVHKMADQIETHLSNSLEREVTSQSIGELLMEKLRKLDQVAYVRFASVYRDFGDIDTFLSEIHKLRTEDYSNKKAIEREDAHSDNSHSGNSANSGNSGNSGAPSGLYGDMNGGDVSGAHYGIGTNGGDHQAAHERPRMRPVQPQSSASRPPRRKRPRRSK